MSRNPVSDPRDPPDPPADATTPPPIRDPAPSEPGDVSPAAPSSSTPQDLGVESSVARLRRMAHRTRLHLYALVAVVLLVYVVALATTNTRRVPVDWIFAHSSVPIVWLTLFSAIVGWLLGILLTMLFRAQTRAPRQPRWPRRGSTDRRDKRRAAPGGEDTP
jgi:uncharacterized integral membrane protein